MKVLSIAFCLSLLTLLSACSSSGEAPIRYYVLGPVDQAELNVDGIDYSIRISDLYIPQYLERYQMVKRAGDNELIFSESHQWGENLRKNLLRTLGVNISTLLATPSVSTPISRSKVKANTSITVFVERFDQNMDGEIMLSARYQIVNDAQEAKTFSHTSSNMTASNSYTAMVSGMAELFNELSREIAQKVIDEASH